MGDAETPDGSRPKRRSWVRKLERLGWRLALKHDFFAAGKMHDKPRTVNRFYDFISPIYDAVFRNLEGFQTGGERLVEDVVSEGDRVLDLGCGTGINFRHILGRKAQPVGLDLNFQMLKKARKSARREGRDVHVLQADATVLPFATGSFDSCTTAYMMVYLSEAQLLECLIEIRRVLVPGGRLGILCGAGERSPRNPRREAWVEVLSKAGFEDLVFDDFYEVLRVVKVRAPAA